MLSVSLPLPLSPPHPQFNPSMKWCILLVCSCSLCFISMYGFWLKNLIILYVGCCGTVEDEMRFCCWSLVALKDPEMDTTADVYNIKAAHHLFWSISSTQQISSCLVEMICCAVCSCSKVLSHGPTLDCTLLLGTEAQKDMSLYSPSIELNI
uniref:Uncharacterized protein n=1 Tax=Rhizophora mucronata TaxID=61149 RepID=A0A2P2P4Y9_RHIMU